jgi:trk system potassium uptake protein TrkA
MSSFAVIGMGNFGGSLAVELYKLGQDVVAVDSDAVRAQAYRDLLPHVVVGDATDRETLGQIGLGQCHCAIVSLGDDLAASVLVVLHCADLGVREIHAKVVSEQHGRILKRVGATRVVEPEREMARRLATRLTSPNLLDYLPITSGWSVDQMRTPKRFVGKRLIDLRLRQDYGVQIVAIRDSGDADSPLRMPSGATELEADDQLVVLGPNEKLDELERL